LEKHKLSGSQAKTAFALRMNCQHMVESAGLNSVGFVTLTVGDFICPTHGKQIPDFSRQHYRCPVCGRKMNFQQVWDAAEASKRINSLRTGLLAGLFSRAIIVSERHESGAIHFHMVAALASGADIRTAYNFAEVRRKNYRSVSKELRAIWAMLREKLPLYGFGRAELAPIRKTGEAVASYAAKYIKKNVLHRQPQDRRKKLVRYYGFNKCHLKPNEFEWDTPSARGWRARATGALDLVGIPLRDLIVTPAPHVKACVGASLGRIRAKCLDGSIARDVLGPKWAYLVSMLLDALELSQGDKLNASFIQGQILCGELQRLAGRSWCESAENPPDEVLLGEKYTRREWREMWAGLPLPANGN